MRKRYLGLLFVVIFLTQIIAWPSVASASPGPSLDTLEEIFQAIEKYHISKPKAEDLIQAGIDGIIGSLHDSHTLYLSSEEIEELDNYLQGNYVGIGIQMEKGDPYPKVTKVFAGSPAAQAGLRTGDLIIKVNGLDTSQITLEQLMNVLRGEEGTEVQLTIRREGSGDFTVKLIRSMISLETVSAEKLDEDTGYIRIDRFGTTTPDELGNKLGSMVLEGTHKLVLDLRDNPGGLVDSVAMAAGNFLPSGKLVVSLVDRDGQATNSVARGFPVAEGIQMVVLVDKNTASAAEILAGDLQDYGIAKLVGERTYGKGTAQITVPLQNDDALVVTVARFTTPNGRVIDGVGLAPDIQVLTPELALIAAHRQLEPPNSTSAIFDRVQPEVQVDGNPVPFRQKIIDQAGTTYLPLRFTLEALGYQVFWKPEISGVEIIGFASDTIFNLGTGNLTIDGQAMAASNPFLEDGGAAYLPLSDLSLMGIRVQVDGRKIELEKGFAQ